MKDERIRWSREYGFGNMQRIVIMWGTIGWKDAGKGETALAWTFNFHLEEGGKQIIMKFPPHVRPYHNLT